jgi:hypothetical protein
MMIKIKGLLNEVNLNALIGISATYIGPFIS